MKKNITCLYFSLVIIVVASCNMEESTKSEFEDIYRNQIENYIANESVKLCNVSLQKGIDSINTYFLSEIIRGEILVYVFSGEMCNLCIETTIDKLKSTFVDYSTNDKIVLLSTNVNPRLKEAYYGKELYSYDNMKLNIPYEKKGLPYMFVVDSNMQVKLFFIPDIRTPELTDYYLSCMNKRFF